MYLLILLNYMYFIEEKAPDFVDLNSFHIQGKEKLS